MNGSLKNVICLTAITLVAGLSLGYVYDLTKEPIARMEENTKLEAYKAVFPEAETFGQEEPADATYVLDQLPEGCEILSSVEACDASGNNIGYVINVVTHEGYGGDISLSMGVDSEGCVRGVEILKIGETAGLGMKAKEEKFISQFANKTVTQFAYTKTGASADFEIDALSGATITTKAVTNAVNAGLAYFQSLGGAGI
ncbi:MAG: RnfABCDGE type electron transport complex subunit G [Lachnospiraceae bacterium]|nr:RnfABCDGE type electron transport complex subunit G [Lachnospiraceae bacterium]